MNDLLESIRRYSIACDRKIQEICSPLAVHLGIPYFTYYFIEEDGRFGTIANNPEFMEFYYSNQMYMNNPYMAHPNLFRSGYILAPCAFDEEMQKVLKQRYQTDHLFLTLRRTEKRIEGFIFANEGFNIKTMPHYTANLDLLVKFTRYFKKEAATMIGRLHAERFNMHQARGEHFLDIDPSVPLSDKNQNIKSFLRDIYGLSPQEERCLEFFKQGNSAQSTAALMELSPRTVETYFENIKKKLGCSSKWELLEY